MYLLFINYESNLFDKIRISSFNVLSILLAQDMSLMILVYGETLIFFLFLMFIGGCAGSTACGIKIFIINV